MSILDNPLRIEPLLDALFDQGATDLHLSAGAPPSLRVDGHLAPATSRVLTPAETESLCNQLVNDAARETLEEKGAVDFSFQWNNRGRIRGNAFKQRNSLAIALRGRCRTCGETLTRVHLLREALGVALCTGAGLAIAVALTR